MSKVDWKVVLGGIICITILAGLAIYKGIDGLLLTMSIGVIAMGIGVNIPKEKIIK